MKNRTFLVLTLLAANDRWGQPNVHRTVLVKQAFLAETIRPLYRVWLQTFGFVRYKFGPWAEEIFECVDALIFNGLVEVVDAQRRLGQLEARYRITAAGQRVMARFADSEIVGLSRDLVWALQSLGIEQAGTMCKLVYEEAEFARLFARHQEEGIGPEAKVPLQMVTTANNETFAILATLQELLRPLKQPNGTLPSREVVRIFLRSLAAQIPAHKMSKRTAA